MYSYSCCCFFEGMQYELFPLSKFLLWSDRLFICLIHNHTSVVTCFSAACIIKIEPKRIKENKIKNKIQTKKINKKKAELTVQIGKVEKYIG